MYGFLLALLMIDAVILVAAVLLQAGKGGGMASSFGGASSSATSLIGTRQAGDLLTKASWWCGGIFIFLAFVLQLMSSRTAAGPSSILDQIQAPPAAQTQTAPNTPSAVPLTPANPTPAPTTPPQP